MPGVGQTPARNTLHPSLRLPAQQGPESRRSGVTCGLLQLPGCRARICARTVSSRREADNKGAGTLQRNFPYHRFPLALNHPWATSSQLGTERLENSGRGLPFLGALHLDGEA